MKGRAITMDLIRLGHGLISTFLFGIVGIFLTAMGFKIFDWITPRIDVERELTEGHNLAVAIVMAAVIIGISAIAVAAIVG